MVLEKEELQELISKEIDKGIDRNKTIRSLKTDVAGLKTDVAGLKTEQHRQGLLMEEMCDNIKLITEALSPLPYKGEKITRLEEKVVDQADQIKVTQWSLQKHIQDKKIHLS